MIKIFKDFSQMHFELAWSLGRNFEILLRHYKSFYLESHRICQNWCSCHSLLTTYRNSVRNDHHRTEMTLRWGSSYMINRFWKVCSCCHCQKHLLLTSLFATGVELSKHFSFSVKVKKLVLTHSKDSNRAEVFSAARDQIEIRFFRVFNCIHWKVKCSSRDIRQKMLVFLLDSSLLPKELKGDIFITFSEKRRTVMLVRKISRNLLEMSVSYWKVEKLKCSRVICSTEWGRFFNHAVNQGQSRKKNFVSRKQCNIKIVIWYLIWRE